MMNNNKDIFSSSNSMFFSDLMKPPTGPSSSLSMDPLLSSRTLSIPAHDISPVAPPFTGLGLKMSPLVSSLDGPPLPNIGRLPQPSNTLGGINPTLSVATAPVPAASTLDFTTLQDDCSDFPPEVTERLIEVIKRYPDGILGSQLPEAYRKIFGDKLMLETVKGRKIKLMNILDGHPNARKDTSGILKWFYVPTPPGQTPAAQIKSAWSNPNRSDKVFASGIEQDLLGPEAFPSVAWMRDYGMHLYRWAGNESEWTEFALRLRPEMAAILDSEGEGGLASLRRKSGCDVSISTEKLRGKQEKFCVLVRGESGSKSNATMSLALELIAQQFRDLIKLTNLDKDETKDDDNFTESSEPRGERSNDGRIHRTIDLTPYAVLILTAKNNKKLNILRKKSGAYVNILPPKVVKGTKTSSKLTISGTAATIEIALTMATSFINSTVIDGNEK